MKAIENQPCPLCESDAQSVPGDHGYRKHFSCSVCADFVITRAAERMLRSSASGRRTQLSQRARCAPADRVLEIRTELQPDQPKMLSDAYIPRARCST